MNSPVEPGQVLAGKYRVERVIGIGGMGVVVSATHVQLDDRVALKFLLPSALESEDVIQRFGREARAAVRIKSEHVARVSDVGVLENGAPYMVMEYLEGQDLAAVVSRAGPLPIETAVEYILQACDALADAHGMGIIHRDLKPANLFLTKRKDGTPCVKLLDFGISKTSLTGTAAPDMALTSTTAVMGSPLYMSPEQMRSARDVDHRTDIWALGVTLHELLTGQAAFRGDTITQLVAAVLTEMPPPLRAVRPDAPVDLQVVLLKCLEKQPRNRYETIAELAVALAPHAPKRALSTVERIVGMARASGKSVVFEVQAAQIADMGTTTSWTDEKTGVHVPKRSMIPFVVGGVLGLVALLGVVAFFMRSKPAAPPVSDAARADRSTPAASVAPAVPSSKPTAAIVTPVDSPPPAASPTAPATGAPPPAATNPKGLSSNGGGTPLKPKDGKTGTPAPKPAGGTDIGF